MFGWMPTLCEKSTKNHTGWHTTLTVEWAAPLRYNCHILACPSRVSRAFEVVVCKHCSMAWWRPYSPGGARHRWRERPSLESWWIYQDERSPLPARLSNCVIRRIAPGSLHSDNSMPRAHGLSAAMQHGGVTFTRRPPTAGKRYATMFRHLDKYWWWQIYCWAISR